jgi:hypothetical protein
MPFSFLGEPERVQRFETMTPDQLAFSKQKLADARKFNPDVLESQAMQNFNRNIVPSLANRFASYGNDAGSSSYRAAMGSAGTGLAKDLYAMKQGYYSQGAQEGMRPRFQEFLRPETGGMLQTLLPAAIGAGLNYAVPGLGNIFGAMGQSTNKAPQQQPPQQQYQQQYQQPPQQQAPQQQYQQPPSRFANDLSTGFNPLSYLNQPISQLQSQGYRPYNWGIQAGNYGGYSIQQQSQQQQQAFQALRNYLYA